MYIWTSAESRDVTLRLCIFYWYCSSFVINPRDGTFFVTVFLEINCTELMKQHFILQKIPECTSIFPLTRKKLLKLIVKFSTEIAQLIFYGFIPFTIM
jgi:hypothetical protein